MQWKIAGIQVAALFITVLVAIKLFTPGNATQKSFDSRLQAIEDRLEKIEKNLAAAERSSLNSRPPQIPSRAEKQPSNLSISNDAFPLRKTWEKPADTERGSLSPPPSAGSSLTEERPSDTLPPVAAPPSDDPATSTTPSPKGSLQALDSFFSELPAEKHSQAEGIFQSHLESLRFKIDDATKQGMSPQELNTLIYDDQSQIREEMKQVLSDQEYKAFMDAVPMIPKPN